MSEQSAQRLFFALWPDKQVRQDLNALTTDLSALSPSLVHQADLHITLQFLGQVTAALYPCIEQVAESIDSQPFRLKIDNFGYWRRPRVIWCGPSETPWQLTELVASLRQRLLSCGIRPEKREFAPHITLARKARFISSYTLFPPIFWNNQEFVLVTSDSGRRIPRYAVTKRWSLDS